MGKPRTFWASRSHRWIGEKENIPFMAKYWEEKPVEYIEKSAYDDLKAKLEIAREALDSLSSSTHHRNIADEQELRQRTAIARQALKQIGEE